MRPLADAAKQVRLGYVGAVRIGLRQRGDPVTQFMVERHLEGFPPDQLPAAAAAAKRAAGEITAEGNDVRYLRSTWVPEGERCYCLFEGESRSAVEEVQRRASLPFKQIHEAAFLTAEDV